jgi:hypothetical protein
MPWLTADPVIVLPAHRDALDGSGSSGQISDQGCLVCRADIDQGVGRQEKICGSHVNVPPKSDV